MTADDQTAGRKARRRAIPGTSEAEERLLAMVTALTAQLAVTRERVDTLERLLSRAGTVTPEAIEDFAATDVEAKERDSLRRGIIAKVFRPLQEAAERDLRRAQSQAGNGEGPSKDSSLDSLQDSSLDKGAA